MPFVITRNCDGVCDTACVDVCPSDCIVGPVPLAEIRAVRPEQRKQQYTGVQMFIDPDECVDCGACVPECPEDAIFADHDLLPGSDDAARNAAFFRRR